MRDCGTCKYSGCDPDGPYCAHPKVLEKHHWGLDLSSQALPAFCSEGYSLWESKKMKTDRPVVITLCGSSRFKEQHEAIMARETLLGKIVIPMGFYHHKQQVPITVEQKQLLDELHFRKIDLSNGILVVNPNGYIGESTANEIAYALQRGKGLEFTDHKAGEAWLEEHRETLAQKIADFALRHAGVKKEKSDD